MKTPCLQKTPIRLVVVIVAPLALFLGIWGYDFILRLLQAGGVCNFYLVFRRYCPACGGTRSLTALMQGDILSSLRYNLVVPFLGLVFLALYSEWVLSLFGRKITILPRKKGFLFGTLIFFGIYFIVRNFFPYLTPPIL